MRENGVAFNQRLVPVKICLPDVLRELDGAVLEQVVRAVELCNRWG